MPVRDLLSAASGTGGATDPYFYDVSLLLNGDGTNGAQNNTFLDSSTNNFTITRNGNTTQGSFSPYGSLWSNYFNGGTTYLTTSTSGTIGSGNFTMEGWFNATTLSSGGYLFNVGDDKLSSGMTLYIYDQTKFAIWANNTLLSYFTPSSNLIVNNWYHVAVVRNSGTITVYLNGVSIGTASNSQNLSGKFTLGAEYNNSTYYPSLNAYLSNVRYTNTAVYTTTFTPSTTPLTAISGTQFLSCQSNRFIDNSSNNATITTGGTPSVQRFSPFNPTAPYSTSVIGGSGYFDGSTAYLTTPSNSAFALGSGDWTIETWFYALVDNSSNGKQLFDFRTGDSITGGLQNYYVWMYINGNYIMSNGNVDPGSVGAGSDYKLNTWNHVAYVKSSGTIKIYVNGVSIASRSDSYNASSNTSVFIGCAYNGTQFTQGYLEDFRIVKGTAVYTTNFTPPTAPETAVSGTSLLLNMTNAGIPDLAMQNDLQTVGSAQVSTSVVKYGTGSLYFPNSGSNYLANYAAPFVDLTNFSTGDFTVETWVYFNTLSINQGIVDNATNTTSAGSGKWTLNINNSNQLCFGQHSVGNIIQYSWSPSTGTWYHIAVTRSNGTVRMFIDGNLVATASSSANFNSSGGIQVAATASYGTLQGYLDDMRITKGIARYVQPFTPPTAALPTY